MKLRKWARITLATVIIICIPIACADGYGAELIQLCAALLAMACSYCLVVW